MSTYRLAAHGVYELAYRFVVTTKYRKPVLRAEVGEEVRQGMCERIMCTRC